jgi:hypothetical protein
MTNTPTNITVSIHQVTDQSGRGRAECYGGSLVLLQSTTPAQSLHTGLMITSPDGMAHRHTCTELKLVHALAE